ncbi:hypothetical protein X809_11075 [Paenibacillus polymyxa CR1]|nr:hypothetical protein X809_11075 [Paenibacillus polymyxa CR1]
MKIYKAFSKFDSSGKIKSAETWNGLLLQWQMCSADVKEMAPITMSLLKISFWCWMVQDIDEMQNRSAPKSGRSFFLSSHMIKITFLYKG